MERVEINNDLTRNEPIREVRQTKDTRTGEATKKKFVAELERRLKRKKKKNSEHEKDRIILEDKNSGREQNKSKDDRKDKNNKKPKSNRDSSPEGAKGHEIDLLA